MPVWLKHGLGLAAAMLAWSGMELSGQGGAPVRNPKGASIQIASGFENEAYVILNHRIRLTYQADGSVEKVEEARIRVQSEAGVNALGQLRWGYNAANESLEVVSVKVHKADGRVVAAPADAVQDLAPPDIHAAPIYTDLRLKVVTVPALRPGDELEFSLRTPRTTPYAPGHFWGEHRFSRDEIAVEELLELDVPSSKPVTIVSAPGMTPKVQESAGRRVTTWTWRHPSRESEGKTDSPRRKQPKAEIPDLQYTTFRSWAEVGDWYADLERPQRALDEVLKAKAKALIEGKATPMEKVQSLYSFVAMTNRYVSLSFGVGRYQPHKASEVLGNQYGDCKDKHTLLAALLEAEGFKVASVLIHSSRSLDPSVPSPAQFDHVFTDVEVGGEEVLLDTTTEVAPFRALLLPLRNKQALRVAPSGTSRLVRTPASNPMPNHLEVTTEGELTDKGDIRTTIKETYQGDGEILVRLALRKTPQSKWKDMLSLGATMSGLFGDLGDIQVSDPSDMAKPLALSFSFSKSQAYKPHGGSGFFSPPISRLRLQAQEVEPGILQIAEGTSIARMSLRLPKGVKAKLPLGIRLKRDFATYQSSYALNGEVLAIERQVAFLKGELPATREADFEAFKKLVEKDHVMFIDLEGGLPVTPVGENATAAELSEAAHTAYQARDYKKAQVFYEKVAKLDPKDKAVWNNLGRTFHALQAYEKASGAYRKAIELNPNEEYAYNNFGRTLWAQKKYSEAEAMFLKQLEVNPYDTYAHGNLGRMFVETKAYDSAVKELQRAVIVDEKNGSLREALAEALFGTKAEAKGMEALEEAVKLSPNPMTKNNAAYSLAKRKVGLDKAREWVDSAIEDTISALKITPLKAGNLSAGMLTGTLASYWDTLGWIYFQQGEYARAESYLKAAWSLSQSSEVGVHLGQVYLALEQKPRATKYFAMAAATARPVPEARERLSVLVGGPKMASERVQQATDALLAERTIKIPGQPKANAFAEFIFALRPGGKVEDVQFLTGDSSLMGMIPRLKGMDHGVPLAPTEGVRVFRRGVLVADPSSHSISLIFVTSDSYITFLAPPVVKTGE